MASIRLLPQVIMNSELVRLQKDWTEDRFSRYSHAWDFVNQNKVHLPHMTLCGNRYHQEKVRVLFVGAEGALCYCRCDDASCSCTVNGAVGCADCQTVLRGMEPEDIHAFLAAYWKERLDEEGAEQSTQFWRAIRNFTNRLNRATAESTGEEVARSIAWGNVFRFSYLWHSDDGKDQAQQQGRRLDIQKPGFELLRDEILVLKPHVVVLFTPGDATTERAYRTALDLPSFHGKIKPDEYFYETVAKRHIYTWQDEQDPNSLVGPVVVRTGHPIRLSDDALTYAADEAHRLLSVTKPAWE